MYCFYFINPRHLLYILVPGERLVFFIFDCVMYTYAHIKKLFVFNQDEPQIEYLNLKSLALVDPEILGGITHFPSLVHQVLQKYLFQQSYLSQSCEWFEECRNTIGERALTISSYIS